MTQIPYVKLNNGIEMPQLGIGTFLMNGDEAVQRIKYALQLGYRLIDTAQGYGNEAEVGKAIAESHVDRKELFITTKINTSEMRNGTVRQSIDESLAKLGTEYIDLMLIHWPVAGKVKGTWKILEEYADKGKIRCIGVSNFTPAQLNDLLSYARIKPVINQIEIHPYMTQFPTAGYTFRKGIQVESWGPLGQGTNQLLEDTALIEIANKYNKSAAQIVLRWHIQRGLVIMPRCDVEAYTKENMQIFDFELSPADMEIINGLNLDRRTNVKNNPENFPW